jgi:CheY-like chemotaxis protein
MLSAMLGFSTLAQMKIKPDDPSQPYLEEINKLVDRGANLTKSLLAFSRKQMLTMKPVSLNTIVNSMGKLLLRVIGADIQLSINLPGKDIIVLADSSQLDQIMLNLATNARDAMPNGGRLTINLDILTMDDEYIRVHGYGELGTYAVISVQDSGTGIDGVIRDKIFEPFFTTKATGKGTGLGLAIVYGIVKQHSGYIDVYSEAESGTTVKILLPKIDSQADPCSPRHNVPPSKESSTILLAEDDPSVRSGIKILLTELGYNIIEAANGIEAVEEFTSHGKDIDLIILDIIMPLMNGKEAYDAIVRIRPDARVLFMSGYTSDYMQAKVGMNEGMHFLAKPVAPRDLLDKITEILEK